ncbi:tetratricopeptide repeat protein [bacterium]|nr:tetratricopeptide repeat protein [bacterium]
MKKFTFPIIFTLIFYQILIGQSMAPRIGFSLGSNLLCGDNNITNSKVGFNGYVFGSYPITRKLSIQLLTGYGQLKMDDDKSVINTDFRNVEIDGKYNFFNYELFHPFVYCGFGVFRFKQSNLSNWYYDGQILGGIGIDIKISRQWSLSLLSGYHYTTGDGFDGNDSGGSFSKDGYFNFQVGLDYSLDKLFFKTKHKIKAKDSAPIETPLKIDSIKVRDLKYEMQEYHEKVLNLNENVSKLTNQLSEKSQALENKNKNIKELAQIIETKDSLLTILYEKLNHTKKEESLTQKTIKDTNYISPKKIEEVYESALNEFNNGRYKKALHQLIILNKQFPNHWLASNFEYWIGECYFGLEDYQSALAHFKLIEIYKESQKHDDALLMAGICYIRLGEKERASEVLHNLLSKYPKSEYINLTNEYLQGLKE